MRSRQPSEQRRERQRAIKQSAMREQLQKMRFHARHVGSGVWGVFDAGVMGWRASDLSEDEAHEQAANPNVIFNQYGQRDQADRFEVKPPVEVESATWSAVGKLDYWVKEEREWWGRVRRPDGHQMWIRASDLRRSSSFNQ
jgi:hypothetical protein